MGSPDIPRMAVLKGHAQMEVPMDKRGDDLMYAGETRRHKQPSLQEHAC